MPVFADAGSVSGENRRNLPLPISSFLANFSMRWKRPILCLVTESAASFYIWSVGLPLTRFYFFNLVKMEVRHVAEK